MKWPNTLTLIRHDTSAYNVLKEKKIKDPDYAEFVEAWRKDYRSEHTMELAKIMQRRYALRTGDHDTPLVDPTAARAQITAKGLQSDIDLPDVIFVSPYLRTTATLEGLCVGWPELRDVQTFEEERISEQNHGLATAYSDWRVFMTKYPEQRDLKNREGAYWYRYPQGENVPDVRERNRSFVTTLIREFSECSVLVVTHHLTILSIKANLNRWTVDKFIGVDRREKPINCGVTVYRGNPNKGKDGKLELDFYNRKYY